jgi:hypothetical protein
MSDFTQTPNLGLYKPTYDADAEQWGAHLNSNADILDTALAPGGTTFLPIAGGTMTGPVALAGPSTTPTAVAGNNSTQIANTAFVTSAVAAGGPFLPLSGGTVSGAATFAGPVRMNGAAGFNNTAPIAKPTVSGAKSSNAALGSLLTALAAYGLVTDTTTA